MQAMFNSCGGPKTFSCDKNKTCFLIKAVHTQDHNCSFTTMDPDHTTNFMADQKALNG